MSLRILKKMNLMRKISVNKLIKQNLPVIPGSVYTDTSTTRTICTFIIVNTGTSRKSITLWTIAPEKGY